MNKKQQGMQLYKINGKEVSEDEFRAAGGFDAAPGPITLAPKELEDDDGNATGGKLLDLQTRQQAFFADLEAETRKPHTGEHFKTFVRALLLRAQEADLYHP